MANVLGTQNDDFVSSGSSPGVTGVATNGSDVVYGLNGNDILKGLGGADYLYGGHGNDLLIGNGSANADGADYMEGGLGHDSADGQGGNDRIYGGDGNDALRGNTGNDLLYGGEGTDRLEGGDDDDVLYGGAGDEKGSFLAPDNSGALAAYEGGLFGGNGNDEIYGGGGSDNITGGMGTDVMYGGKGADTFFFTSVAEIGKGSASDLIGDFRRKDGDLIDLSAIDAKENKSGDQKFKYIGDNKFKGKAGELSYKNGKLKGDTDGDGKADFALLINTNKMVASDFVL